MMQNRAAWADYAHYTAQFSSLARQLAFAGAAICWFFKTPDVTFPHIITVSLIAYVSFFLLDLLQYYVAALILNVWIRAKERQLWARQRTIDGDYSKPAWLDLPAFALFHLKFLALALGYLFLAWELLMRAVGI